MEGPKPRGPNKRAGERGPNVNPTRELGHFARSLRARKEFLRQYAISGSIAQGAGYIGVTKECIYDYRNKHPHFALLMEKIRRKFRAELEGEARRRAVEGWLEPVFGKDGRIGSVRRFDSRLLELLLKKNIASFTDKVEVEHGGAVAQMGLADLRSLSKEGRENLRKVLQELAPNGPTPPEAPEGS